MEYFLFIDRRQSIGEAERYVHPFFIFYVSCAFMVTLSFPCLFSDLRNMRRIKSQLDAIGCLIPLMGKSNVGPYAKQVSNQKYLTLEI